MSARDAILAQVRRNEPAGDFPLPEVHVFTQDDGGDPQAYFGASLKAMGGTELPLGGGDVASVLAAQFPDATVIASAVPELTGTLDLNGVQHQADLHDVDIAVVRASLAVGETGSVLFTGADIVVNSLVYLAQHLVVLVDPADVVPGLQEAYLRPEFFEHAYTVFHSGPSATADIEGVLIHGAQGVRSLNVVWLPRA